MGRKQFGAVPLPTTGAVGAVLSNVFQSVVQHQASEIAIKAFIEGRGLAGEWELDLVARLVPARPKPVIVPDPEPAPEVLTEHSA